MFYFLRTLTSLCDKSYKSFLKPGLNIVEKDSTGFIVVQLKHEFFGLSNDLYICFAYIPPNTSRYYELPNSDYFDLLGTKLIKYSEDGDFCIIGDLNARRG